MDIKGAKALKDRLGPNRADEIPPATADALDDAPPVYRWLGVRRRAPETPAAGDDEVLPARPRAT